MPIWRPNALRVILATLIAALFCVTMLHAERDPAPPQAHTSPTPSDTPAPHADPKMAAR